MDWLKGMNGVIEHIEENLTQPIKYELLSRIVGCSIYEFSRIFSFMTGMSVSEYIRRRRLSQAVFDIQNVNEKIIDIALKYCYESHTTFTRAFKELHGTTPVSARKTSVSLKTYPPISFVLTIKGVDEMDFRIEKMGSFQIMGLAGYFTPGEEWKDSLWGQFLDGADGADGSGTFNQALWNKGNPSFYTSPFWQVGATDFHSIDGKTPTIIGAEYKGAKPDIENLSMKTIPEATWAVFTFKGETGAKVGEAITRIVTEWFPQSQYVRNENVPMLDSYPDGQIDENYKWEIWMPVLSK
ncbi:MAG: AraC family transcriptional regulator [Defluviitaleaceae bacterium]|nr:AraC family transcriptional regulator [Defluviitaleaceae bacterium]